MLRVNTRIYGKNTEIINIYEIPTLHIILRSEIRDTYLIIRFRDIQTLVESLCSVGEGKFSTCEQYLLSRYTNRILSF